MKRKIARAYSITALFLTILATPELAFSDQLKITSVTGADEYVATEKLYIVRIPASGGSAKKLTVTGSGNVDPPGNNPCTKLCINGTTVHTGAVIDGDPTYTFSGPGSTTAATRIYDISSSTTAAEVTFAITKKEQKYKCPTPYTGGPFTQSNTDVTSPDHEVKVLIYKIETETVATSPSDRKRTKIGVGEDVSVKFLPSSVSPSWSVEPSGKGSVTPTSGSTTTYTASEEAATPSVKGTFKGTTASVGFTVVEPSGVKMEASSDSSTKSPLKAGFVADVYYLPADVNFEKISVYEGTCTAVTTGYFDVAPFKGAVHATGSATGMSGHVAGKGTKDSVPDTVHTVAPTIPYANGTFKWPIPWYYKLGSIDKRFGSTVDHLAELSVSGGTATLKQSKAGESKQSTTP